MATIYVSTTGNDTTGDGSIGNPYATWEKLSTVLSAGDTAYIRGGTYRCGKAAGVAEKYKIQNLTGTALNPINIFAYPGESPILNLDDVLSTNSNTYSFYVYNCDYVNFKGLRVTGQAQNPSANVIYGWINESCTHLNIELCEVDNIGGQGFFDFNTTDTYWLKCDVHHCGDEFSGWGGSNGFSATGGGNTSTNLTYDQCRAWWISDDGWDFFACDATVVIKNCWSFWNGYQPGTFLTGGDGSGYKLGPSTSSFPSTLKRTLTNNLSFENRAKGFDQNGGEYLYNVYNNISFNNLENGYVWSYFPSIAQQSKNNAWHYNLGGSPPSAFQGSEIEGDHNTWNGLVTISNADFLSVSSTGVNGARQVDGSLPNLNFLKLVSGSDLIDAGVNVGLPFNGSAPDMGAFEFDTTTTTTSTSTTTTTTTAPMASYFTKTLLRMGIIANSKPIPTTTTTSTSTTTTTTTASPNIARIQAKSGKNNSVTFDTNPIAGNTVVVGVLQIFESYPLLANVTDNQGNVYVLTGQATDAGADGTQVSLYHKIGVASSGTFTVSVTGINNYDRIFIMEYDNIGTFDQVVSADNNASTTASPGAITPAEANELMIILSSNDEPNDGTLTVTPPSGFTEVLMANNGTSETTGFLLDREVCPAGVVTPASTINHTLNSTTIVAAFKKT